MDLCLYRPTISSIKKDVPGNFLENYVSNKRTHWSIGFKLVNEIENADYFMLPGVWNYYVENHKIRIAGELVKQAQDHNKKTIIFSSGDYTANIPFKDCIVIQLSGFKSRDGINGNKFLAFPTFIDDYLNVHFQEEFVNRNFEKKPVIGFCGQSTGSWFDYARRELNIKSSNFRYKLGVLKWEPPGLEPTRFRHNILETIARSSDLQTNFIMRKKYRAGYRTKEKDPFHSTRVEFVNNIYESDYTVCMRGGGNFSVRFYETLVLGRIPIFINTDCILPLDDMVNYKDYMVWVEESELPFINQKILDFHNSLNQKKFTELQHACRELWETYLTKDGFYLHLADQLRTLIDNAN